MKKRVLMVATVPSMIGQFNMNNIKLLMGMGYQVDVAADCTDTSVWPIERIEDFKKELSLLGITCLQIDFSRSPLKIGRHVKSYKQLIELINDRKYTFIHTHTPIASAVVRLAAKKCNTKVIYTAHGFHFYDGAPIKNWIVYYPMERWLSRYTDALIVINQEDYARAKKAFRAKQVFYVPGVGIDTKKFSPSDVGRSKIRSELQVGDEQIVILSVGELNRNKNHVSVIRAIAGMKHVIYVVVGKGELKKELEDAADSVGVDLRLMGWRGDVIDFYSAADVYVLPSHREGLNVSLMEAMSCGLSVACGNIRGNRDLISKALFETNNPLSIRNAIQDALKHKLEYGENNRKEILGFSREIVKEKMFQIYSSTV